MGLTEKQEALVKESWDLLKQNIPEHSLRLFSLMVEVAPAGKNKFSFRRDSDLKLRAHAAKVFKMIGESIIQLRENAEVLVANLKQLGSVHLKNGINDPYFEVLKEALLKTIKEGVGEKWSDEMGSAWGETYDQLAAAIKAGMKEDATSIKVM